MVNSEQLPFADSSGYEGGERTHFEEVGEECNSADRLLRTGLPSPEEFFSIRKLLPITPGIGRTKQQHPFEYKPLADGSLLVKSDQGLAYLFNLQKSVDAHGQTTVTLYDSNTNQSCSLGRKHRFSRNLIEAVHSFFSKGKFPSHLRSNNSAQ